MLELFGFLMLVLIMLLVTLALGLGTCVGGLDCSPIFSQYNGNKLKAGFILMWIFVIWLWTLVIPLAPFTIAMSI